MPLLSCYAKMSARDFSFAALFRSDRAFSLSGSHPPRDATARSASARRVHVTAPPQAPQSQTPRHAGLASASQSHTPLASVGPAAELPARWEMAAVVGEALGIDPELQAEVARRERARESKKSKRFEKEAGEARAAAARSDAEARELRLKLQLERNLTEQYEAAAAARAGLTGPAAAVAAATASSPSAASRRQGPPGSSASFMSPSRPPRGPMGGGTSRMHSEVVSPTAEGSFFGAPSAALSGFAEERNESVAR